MVKSESADHHVSSLEQRLRRLEHTQVVIKQAIVQQTADATAALWRRRMELGALVGGLVVALCSLLVSIWTVRESRRQSSESLAAAHAQTEYASVQTMLLQRQLEAQREHDYLERREALVATLYNRRDSCDQLDRDSVQRCPLVADLRTREHALGVLLRMERQRHAPDLRLLDLDLCGARLKSIDLHGADLTEAKFDDADLEGANLADATLNGASLRRTFLQHGNLARAKLMHAHLEGVWLNHARLEYTSFFGARLRNAQLNGAEISGAVLAATDLQNANLMYSTFDRSTLRDANLRGANLRGAHLQLATLDDAILIDALFGATDFPNGFDPFGRQMIPLPSFTEVFDAATQACGYTGSMDICDIE